MDNIKFTVENINILNICGKEVSRDYVLVAKDGTRITVDVPYEENRSRKELMEILRIAALYKYEKILEKRYEENLAEARRVHVGDVI